MPEKILRFLKEKDKFVSGARMSSELGISRAAVWKKIGILRRQGFIIKAVSSRGYKLIRSPDLSADEIALEVQGDFWKRIFVYESVDSTNEVAASLSIRHEIGSGTVIVADTQENGRGRLGRAWISPPGVNIYMSIILKPELQPRDATLLTVLASVACTAALRNTGGLPVSIKWPNDLLVAGKKVGGILTEVRSEPDKIRNAIIGIGINVNIEKNNFPSDIRSIATSVRAETGENFSRSGIIVRILQEFEKRYKLLKRTGRGRLLDEWRRFASTLGQNVRIAMGKEVVSGRAEDIDDEGMLLLRLRSGALKKISSGEITVLR